jgi:hypothetical protein
MQAHRELIAGETLATSVHAERSTGEPVITVAVAG